MYLSGLIHRDRLYDIACRWLADRVEPGDGRVLTEIFVLERTITAPVVRAFVADILHACHSEELYLERVTSKDEVRQAIVAAATYPTARVEEVIDWYRQLPEEFFPRTPTQMSLVTLRNGRLVGLIRRKRIRRIADKVSRHITERLAGEVEAVKRNLAASLPREGAGLLRQGNGSGGIPPGVLGAAERLVADRIRSGRLRLDPERHRVDDVIGVKIIGTDAELAKVERALDEREGTWAFHREVHGGRYVGTHYLVDLELPPPESVISATAGVDWSFAAGRGLDPSELPARFRDYVTSGSRTFRVELILTSFEDLVESEFGDCIHEQRILEQRDRASDFGRLATNASWIIEYMLRLATSPTVTVRELPVKIWGRYIRDTVAHAIARLDGGEPDAWLVPRSHYDGLMQL